jgi:metallo-beta-lactamase family protein
MIPRLANRMRLSFHGAAREVTGSCHLVEVAGRRILLDCGMIQGGSERHERNREPFAFDPSTIDCVVVSHAHIDHVGRLPLLIERGYRGPILATPPTRKLCGIMLADAGRIQEEDARAKIERLRRAGQDASWVRPLYTERQALAVLDRIVDLPFGESRPIEGAGRVSFLRAGHILGAAIVRLDVEEGAREHRIVFSGDIGTDGARLVAGPESVEAPDDLLIESTYGDRRRPPEPDITQALHDVIRRTVDRGGNLVIPAFAVGRTQALLTRINALVEAGRLPGLAVFVDSPMAVAATSVFAMFPDVYTDEAREQLRAGDLPLAFPGLKLVTSVAESRAIAALGPCVIISASGMATAGRVRHHLENNLGDPRSTVLFVGFQAEGTLGRVIQQGTNPVRIFGNWHEVRAEIVTIESLSAHADLDGLLAWYGSLGRPPRRTWVVHGEEAVALSFAATLRERFGADIRVPHRGESFEIP